VSATQERGMGYQFSNPWTSRWFLISSRRCFEVNEGRGLTFRKFWNGLCNIGFYQKNRYGVQNSTLTSKRISSGLTLCLNWILKGSTPAEVVEAMVSLGKFMSRDMDKGDIYELVEAHSERLTTEELKKNATGAAAHVCLAGNRKIDENKTSLFLMLSNKEDKGTAGEMEETVRIYYQGQQRTVSNTW